MELGSIRDPALKEKRLSVLNHQLDDLERTFGHRVDPEDHKPIALNSEQFDKEVLKNGEDSLMVSLSI